MSRSHSFARLWRACGLLALLCGLGLHSAQAHLMVAQRGTLNIVGGGGFVVMALPVDAFTGVDDDGDGRMTLAEMRQHAGRIEAQVIAGLKLLGDDGPRPLEGLMLSLSPDDRRPTAPAQHLVVLGRFALAEGDVVSADAGATASRLRLRFTLFGRAAEAQRQQITITHGADQQLMVLTPGHNELAVLPSAWQVFRDNAVLGAGHIVLGLDHLLFLLVVLASGSSLRQMLLALTAFTVGHAITLTISVVGGFAMPPAIVEPAIAVTIIGMAALDLWRRRRGQPIAAAWRLALVFGCALIHGLALGNALTDAGLDGRWRLASLAGFNLGVEAAQVAIALVAAGLVAGLRPVVAARTRPWAAHATSLAAIGMGGFWLMERLAAAHA